ncbi:SusE domain-containing protein [Alkalitalea saponilacus]|uniref:SusE outer membrane protein n=1 Tax=Alkalitalea saponilacus TaxID=889453 RepID=A0A1T5HLT2_9BACT|nr:SusE domain-containing protein [Alkalitalea saponilacus]ASB47821.1 hypothetical protein CDL62_00970 [Alkalitalea saponilacus]SKC21511.1 SusE outer membrane protein [Alkalitalea saponilacus]
MKYKVLSIALLTFVLTSCYDREYFQLAETVQPVLSSSESISDVVIEEDALDQNFTVFSWTAASFGDGLPDAEYALRMDLAGNNFQNPISLGRTKSLSISVLNSRMNQNLLSIGIEPGNPASIEFQLHASINPDVSTISNIVTSTVTPLEVVIEYPTIYLAGDHNGWSFNDQLYSMRSDEIYEGFIYMDNGDNWIGFKMSYEPDWIEDLVIGDPDDSGTSGTLQVGNWGGSNIYATEGPGYYRIRANLVNNTISILKTEWAITGDFNGWSFTPLVYDTDDKVWSATIDMTAGGFKFIANEDWSLVFGDDDLNGVLDPGRDDNNIQITEDGNYTIIMDLSGAPYVYSIVKN